MAKVIGAVRFPDGELRYFIYNMFSDTCRPKLFQTEQEASDAWDDDQSGLYQFTHVPGGEIVEVITTFGFGSREVRLYTRADREKGLITGPLDYEGAMRDPELDKLLMGMEEKSLATNKQQSTASA